jgi:hypothetical protein
MTTRHDSHGFVFTIAHQRREPAYVVDSPDISNIIKT